MGWENGSNGIVKAEPEAAVADPLEGLTAIGPVGGERKIRDWALVLQSIPIWHATRRTMAGWVLFVRDEDYSKARRSIDRYEQENRDWPPRRTRERPAYAESPVAPLVFAGLIAFFFLTGPVAMGSRWFQRGIAISDHVVSNAPWQAVTALTLHADIAHVMGNAISGTVFGSAVMRRLGPGAGALAILASGIVGNVVNAVYHHAMGTGDHGSLGASTAVFGAIGVLAATQLVIDRTAKQAQSRRWFEIVAPVVGGLALLGALGASPSADLGAHLFGFFGGVAVGLLAAFPLRKSMSVDFAQGVHTVALAAWRRHIQAILGALAAGIVVGSWILAFARR